MNSFTLSALCIYPVKSCGPIALAASEVTPRGLLHDRRLMIVDQAGMFVTQREQPRLCLVSTAIDGETLTLTHATVGSVQVPLIADASFEKMRTRVWESRLMSRRAPAIASEFFSAILGRPVHLVYMPHASRRSVDKRYASHGEIVSFADGFPVLVTSTASLVDLNQRLQTRAMASGRAAKPASMQRFRPNVVIDGLPPWDEDRIKLLRVGSLELHLVKPCGRCIMVNVDPATARLAREPLATLATFRTQGPRVVFGQNALIRGEGTLAVGMPVRIH